MKKTACLVCLLLLSVLLLSMLSGCTAIEDDEAEVLVLACLDAMVRGDYEAADACFHPLARQEADFVGCRSYVELIRNRHGLDLSAGYTVNERHGLHSPGLFDAMYDYSFEGTVGGVRVAVTAVLYRDADGFGLCELTIAPIKQTVI